MRLAINGAKMTSGQWLYQDYLTLQSTEYRVKKKRCASLLVDRTFQSTSYASPMQDSSLVPTVKHSLPAATALLSSRYPRKRLRLSVRAQWECPAFR